MFRFTIRDVLLVMVIVAMGLGWWIGHAASRIRQVETERLVHLLNADAKDMYRAIDDSGNVAVFRFERWEIRPKSAGPLIHPLPDGE